MVINRCYGGYGLSKAAYDVLCLEFDSAPFHYGHAFRDDRTNPKLIAVVEQLGEQANGGAADLRVVEIPDGVQWHIEEYDGGIASSIAVPNSYISWVLSPTRTSVGSALSRLPKRTVPVPRITPNSSPIQYQVWPRGTQRYATTPPIIPGPRHNATRLIKAPRATVHVHDILLIDSGCLFTDSTSAQLDPLQTPRNFLEESCSRIAPENGVA